MKLARILADGVPRLIRVEGTTFRWLDDLTWPARDLGPSQRQLSEFGLLCPVRPSKIVCVGRNYRAHARELGHEVPAEPLLFLKPPSALAGPDSMIVLPAQSTRVEHEGELAVVIGSRARHVAPTNVHEHILGYTCANDVTARDLQKRDVQFTRAKGFDTFCPVGPWIETERPNADATISVRVNGEKRQNGRIGDMVFDVDTLVSYISHVMTLEFGDVVLTGTPEGVGPLEPGNTVTVSVDGIGTLRNHVSARAM